VAVLGHEVEGLEETPVLLREERVEAGNASTRSKGNLTTSPLRSHDPWIHDSSLSLTRRRDRRRDRSDLDHVRGLAAILPRVPEDWDAATYDRIADPQARWGATVVSWLELSGSEHVLDAGCGSGRVTERLLERLLDGHVVALDGSTSMIEEARRRLAPFGDRITFMVANLLEPLPVDPAVDAILSTATFHWVPDHDALFRNLSAVLRPGGQLAAQCGGRGNLASVERALRDIGAPGFEDKTYATAEATRNRLEAFGFRDVECWLHEEPTPFESAEVLETFLSTVVLRRYVEARTTVETRGFLRDVVSRLPSLELDYVRLNMRARRAS
jgi:trans-aconitate 2-methyltransferase